MNSRNKGNICKAHLIEKGRVTFNENRMRPHQKCIRHCASMSSEQNIRVIKSKHLALILASCIQNVSGDTLFWTTPIPPTWPSTEWIAFRYIGRLIHFLIVSLFKTLTTIGDRNSWEGTAASRYDRARIQSFEKKPAKIPPSWLYAIRSISVISWKQRSFEGAIFLKYLVMMSDDQTIGRSFSGKDCVRSFRYVLDHWYSEKLRKTGRKR